MVTTENRSQSAEATLLVWSAPDDAGEAARRAELGRWLEERSNDDLTGAGEAGWAYPAAAGPVRGALVAATRDEALSQLRHLGQRPVRRPAPGHPRTVALLFPGQGAQYPGMGAGLYGREPVFTSVMEDMFARWGEVGAEMRADWLGDSEAEPFDDVMRSQPLLFAIGVALGSMLMAWGAQPSALTGHSIGEVAAATLAGVFTQEQAAVLVLDRIKRIKQTRPGGILAVAAEPEELTAYLRDGVVIGAVNGPRQTMLAGPHEPLAAVEQRLRAHGLVCRWTNARQAFHSPMVAAACAGAEEIVRTLELRPPQIPVYSAFRARRMDPELATEPAFWAMQPGEPVLFGRTLDLLLERDLLLVEAGPGQGLASLARRHRAVVSGRSDVVAVLPATQPPARAADGDVSDGRGELAVAERRAVLAAAGRIWAEGHDLSLAALKALAG